MERRQIILVSILLAAVAAGMFTFAFLKRTEIQEGTTEPEEQVVEDSSPYDYIDRIDAKHFFIDGVHTLTGEISLPTPCDLLDPQNSVAESFPEQVFIDFNIINTAETCEQVVTPARFKLEFSVDENATFSARLNGKPVTLNLVPASEGETPDDFELYLKG